MSKIIEALEKVRVAAGEVVTRKKNGAKESRASSHQMTQKELADIYFASPGRSKQVPAPTLVRVVEGRKTYLIPWAITTAALIVMSVALFSGKRLWVDVHIVDAGAAGTLGRASAAAQPDPAGTIYLSPADFVFSSAALKGSLKDAEQLVLANHVAGGPVYAAFAFSPPLRASDYILRFEARGRSGAEALEVVFRDGEYRSSLNQRPIRPFPMGLSTEWAPAEVSLRPTNAFDAREVTQIRLETSPERTGNRTDATVFIRNLRWVPKEP